MVARVTDSTFPIGGSTPHYDISLSKKALAIQLRAVELSMRETGHKPRELREHPTRVSDTE
jgi:hypothetical protein